MRHGVYTYHFLSQMTLKSISMISSKQIKRKVSGAVAIIEIRKVEIYLYS